MRSPRSHFATAVAIFGVVLAILVGCSSETTSSSAGNSPEVTLDGPRPASVPGYEMVRASESETGFTSEFFRYAETKFGEANSDTSNAGGPEPYVAWSNWLVTKPVGQKVAYMIVATVDPAVLSPEALADNLMNQMAELATAHGEPLETHAFSEDSASGGGFFAGTSYLFSMALDQTEVRLLSAYAHQDGKDAVIEFADSYAGTATSTD